jgi:hypothetical protein
MVLVESSPVKKTGMVLRAASKPPISKLMPLQGYKIREDMMGNLLAGISCVLNIHDEAAHEMFFVSRGHCSLQA